VRVEIKGTNMTEQQQRDALRYVPAGMAARITNEHESTLRKRAKAGLLRYTRSPGGRFLYDLTDYLPAQKAGRA
jgi:hypothetical protein